MATEHDATRERLRGLVEAGIALSSELSLDALLQKLVETAAELTGARYAALGVIDRTRSGLERFVTAGLDEETRREIGDPPHGRGILGVSSATRLPSGCTTSRTTRAPSVSRRAIRR